MRMTREQKIDAIRREKFFVRGDLAVYAAALLLIALFTLFAFCFRPAAGDRFSVIWRGETIFTASLETDAVYVFYLRDGTGTVEIYDGGSEYSDYNVIEVRSGSVRVRESDCPDGTCRGFGAVTRGDILCVPHDLRIEIWGEGVETDV